MLLTQWRIKNVRKEGAQRVWAVVWGTGKAAATSRHDETASCRSGCGVYVACFSASTLANG